MINPYTFIAPIRQTEPRLTMIPVPPVIAIESKKHRINQPGTYTTSPSGEVGLSGPGEGRFSNA